MPLISRCFRLKINIIKYGLPKPKKQFKKLKTDLRRIPIFLSLLFLSLLIAPFKYILINIFAPKLPSPKKTKTQHPNLLQLTPP